ncbi:Rid family detoxifying hydrolase [Psychroflexus salis]|uniref:Reactive intermediate/imine deaminase n=1 Tax=Psychroflexus salis TaxID=1526574 RepID=A0A917E900_9FLAO|nr:Rid family detoxifying hydrolase [Psychroflexus salis]GGE11099.1 reactive intermediate/imine deaminase [Psychroflexus salis]
MKKNITTEKAPQPIGPYNQAIVFNNMVFTSGQIAINLETGNLIKASIEEETILVMEHLSEILQAANSNFENVIKVSIFVKDMQDFDAINAVYAAYFEDMLAPARETVQVVQLPKNANVEISMIAAVN